jgi:hypothetical protein
MLQLHGTNQKKNNSLPIKAQTGTVMAPFPIWKSLDLNIS